MVGQMYEIIRFQFPESYFLIDETFYTYRMFLRWRIELKRESFISVRGTLTDCDIHDEQEPSHVR